jgi:hexosaminidase
MTAAQDLVLLPAPRSVVPGSGQYDLRDGASIVCEGDAAALFPVARRLQEAVRETQHVSWDLRAGRSRRVGAKIEVSPGENIPEQGYRLGISPDGIDLVAADLAGAFYGTMTLVQMLRQVKGSLPALEVEDWPDFASRGVMLDVSRDKMPKLETVFALVDRFSEWKINHLELYMEHAFGYEDHPAVWAEADPFTGDEILRLDAHCRERFVELVPNQNSFGHMHRWFEHPRYRDLAECPEGCTLELFGEMRNLPPFSLNPTDSRSLDLIAGLYDELLPHFSSRKLNVGCDETWDLGHGRSRAACGEKGEGRVYLEYLQQVHGLVEKRGRTMHFWGDIVIQHPDLVPELPKDSVVLEWGYEADHPFEEHGAEFARSGIPFYVCPGTSTWNSIAGRTENCLGNIRNAATNGLKHGAVGLLNTDWGDNGHLQYLPMSYLGFAVGAARSWCNEAAEGLDPVPALDLHAFDDDAKVLGRLAHDLGKASDFTGHDAFNAGTLFGMLTRPTPDAVPEGVTVESLRETAGYVEDVLGPLGAARPGGADGSLVRGEFANAGRMLLHACERGTAILEGRVEETGERLFEDLGRILGEHRRLWTARNRVAGLSESIKTLEDRRREYLGDD